MNPDELFDRVVAHANEMAKKHASEFASNQSPLIRKAIELSYEMGFSEGFSHLRKMIADASVGSGE